MQIIFKQIRWTHRCDLNSYNRSQSEEIKEYSLLLLTPELELHLLVI